MADNAIVTLKAVIARLKAVTAVTDIVSTRIYTSVPQKATFPYINIRLDSENFSTKTSNGMQHRLIVQAFSRKQSLNEALTIRKAVYDALNKQESSISIAGATLVMIMLDGINTTLREPDGTTWQSVMQFNCIVD